MAKEFDAKILNTTIMGVVESTFDKMCHVQANVAPVVVEKDIIEYNSRLCVLPMEKFNGPAYAAVINYYLSPKDLADEKAVGTFLLYIKEDYIEKFLRVFNRSMKDGEDQEVLLDICGEMGNILAENVKNELAGQGYLDLTISAPSKYLNHVPNGVPFDYSLYTKQEISFTYWGCKSIVVEACMGHVPMKGK